jgi:protein involved in polysaccharide export with SLBB domain
MCSLDSCLPRSLNGKAAQAVLAAAFLLTACGHTRQQRATPAETIFIEPDEQLGIGDVFEVRVAGEADLSGPYQIAADGTIYYPYVGRVPAVGKTSGDIQRFITEQLKQNHILVSPQVSIFVREWNSRKVSVLGQVNKPGSVTYFPRMTIVDAIAAAGGFTGIAAKNSVTLRREVRGRVNSLSYPVADISEGRAGNVFLLPGDVLVVDERMF